jgi:hypothetical protein
MKAVEHVNGQIPRGMHAGRRELGVASVMIAISQAVPPHMRPGTREVSQLLVPVAHRRKHLATALMNLICQEADANSITLLLIVQPFDEGGPDEDALIDWYALFGFKTLQDSPTGTVMARQVQVPNRVRRAVSLALVH